MTCDDIEYFLERAIAEREMAKAARHPNAVTAHEDLALRYDALIKRLPRPLLYVVTAGRGWAGGLGAQLLKFSRPRTTPSFNNGLDAFCFLGFSAFGLRISLFDLLWPFAMAHLLQAEAKLAAPPLP